MLSCGPRGVEKRIDQTTEGLQSARTSVLKCGVALTLSRARRGGYIVYGELSSHEFIGLRVLCLDGVVMSDESGGVGVNDDTVWRNSSMDVIGVNKPHLALGVAPQRHVSATLGPRIYSPMALRDVSRSVFARQNAPTCFFLPGEACLVSGLHRSHGTCSKM